MTRASAVPEACAATAIHGAVEPAPAGSRAANATPPGALQRLLDVTVQTRRARKLAYAAVLLEVAIVTGFAIVYRPFDLNIYLWGGHAVTDASRLYLVQAHANWFTYPPFAAALFTPLTALPVTIVVIGWELATVAAFAWVCVLSLRLAGCWPSKAAVAAVVGAGLLLEPVYHTLFLGQVNVFLLALVLTDIWLVASGKRAGVGIGVAAAIKLTPAIFVVLLLLTRKTKEALIAAGTFAACAVVGCLVDPSASRLYWTRLFYDTARVRVTYISNQSLDAAAARILGGVSHVGTWYLAAELTVGALGLAVATLLARRADWLGAAALTGTTGLLVSPVSWTHHWVWCMPALIVLLRTGAASRVTAAGGYVLFVLAPMWWTPHPGGNCEYGFHWLATLAANSFMLAGLGFLGYMACYTWRTRRSACRGTRAVFRQPVRFTTASPVGRKRLCLSGPKVFVIMRTLCNRVCSGVRRAQVEL
ncbi:MAG TPA: glycosyltransferase 87 family protein [Streptosporangiaceae bacterium]|nr:glycosyltransferase 87 family protein [Streptosporangiaceae bacterium]